MGKHSPAQWQQAELVVVIFHYPAILEYFDGAEIFVGSNEEDNVSTEG
jgi:hypothetical protein